MPQPWWCGVVGDPVVRIMRWSPHWDGTQWSIVPSPNPGAFINELSGVAAISANDVWAVGIYGGPDANPNPSGTLMDYFMPIGLQFLGYCQTCPLVGLCTCIKYFGVAHK